MKNKVLLALMVMVIKSTLVIAWTTVKPTTLWEPGRPRANLNGKMLTLSLKQQGITFFPPNYSPSYSSTFHQLWTTTRPITRPITTPITRPITRPTTTPITRPITRPTTTSTTSTPTTGWSVCLRYLTDGRTSKIFTLCPSCQNPVTLSATSKTSFLLSSSYAYRYGYSYGYRYDNNWMTNFVPDINFLSVSELDIWTRVCVTADTVKHVAQLFSGSNMSVRKTLPLTYSWTGEPVIKMSDFEGQVTDIQMWDYPLNYREVSNYMNYREYRGSILTWSDIGYSVSGNMILEDVYEVLAKEPISRRRKGHRLKGGKKTGRGFNNKL